MKRFLVILACLAIPLAMVAQESSGNIAGTVADPDGNALPGVTVTLSGAKISPIQSITSDEGKFRFLSLFPAKDYQIKMELQGFKTRIETGIVVGIGKTADTQVDDGNRETRGAGHGRRQDARHPAEEDAGHDQQSTMKCCRACPRPATPGSSSR